MTDNESVLGTSDEVSDAKQKLASIQDHNVYASLKLLDAIRQRILVDSAALSSIGDAIPYLFSKFLMNQAVKSLNQAYSLLTAAEELMPIDEGEMTEGKLIMPEPSSSSSEDSDGGGQYI